MKKLLVCLLLLTITRVAGQTSGSIVGIITDKEYNNEPLPFANVLIKGSTKGTTSDFDGLYEIADIEPGTYVVVYSFLGYKTVEVPNVVVEAGKVTTINIPLSANEGLALDEVVVTTVARKDSETALLLDQKKAIEIKQSIGSVELAKKGVSDAEGAVSKVTGVSKQEGVKNVFVRGLGDRYNSTTLNGLPLPSEDPEYKNIALDLFSSNIINSVGINKAFNSSLYGDVAGANIDIVSKSLAGGSEFSVGVSTGINTRTVSKDFLIKDGTNPFGTPTNRSVPIFFLDQYSFNNDLNVSSQNLQTNNSFSISGGKRFNIGETNSLSVFVVGVFDNDYSYKEGENSIVNSQGGLSQKYDYQKYDYTVNQILMGNLRYNFGQGSSISYNSLFVHKNAQSVAEYTGFTTTANDDTSDPNAFKSFLRRQQVNDNILFVNQLLSEIKLTKNLDFDLGVSYNTTKGNEPDRNSFLQRYNGSTYSPITGSAGANSRFYSILNENDLVAKAILKFSWNKENEDDESNSLIRNLNIGYNYRNTDRQFDFIQFNHDFRSPVVVDLDNPDALYNQNSMNSNIFKLITGRGSNADALTPFFYAGKKIIHSGILDITYSFNTKLIVGAGLRFEKLDQNVIYDTNLASTEREPKADPASVNKNYILPSFNLKYSFNENSILRLAGSQSYTLPQFKEVAPFLYEDVSISSFGNPDLLPSDNLNLDLKWEYYFSSGEIIALTGFYKKIKNPINRTQVNSAANESSYVNTGDANIAGLEMELRKKLFSTGAENSESDFFFGLNVSYLYSNQKLIDVATDDLTVRFTNTESKLEGASPLLINSDISYSSNSEKTNFQSSLVFNYFSERVYALGVATKQNIIESSVPTLDWITKLGLGKNYGISLNLKNILDSEFKLTQQLDSGEKVNVSSYKKGLNLSLGFSYKF